MLWFGTPFIGKDSKIFTQFKDKFLKSVIGDSLMMPDPRYKEIRDWYIKVLDNTVDDGYDFYAGYYDTLNDEATYDNPENDGIYSIQDSNRKGPGALGLDAEFIESVILIKSFPDVLFGMDTIDNEVISFTHSLPKDLKFYQIENMKFGDVVYSIRMKKNSFEIFNLKGKVGLKQQVNINIPIEKSNPTITINGEKFNDYQIVNGYISFTYEFTNLNIEIK